MSAGLRVIGRLISLVAQFKANDLHVVGMQETWSAEGSMSLSGYHLVSSSADAHGNFGCTSLLAKEMPLHDGRVAVITMQNIVADLLQVQILEPRTGFPRTRIYPSSMKCKKRKVG